MNRRCVFLARSFCWWLLHRERDGEASNPGPGCDALLWSGIGPVYGPVTYQHHLIVFVEARRQEAILRRDSLRLQAKVEPTPAPEPFVASLKWCGCKAGYAFKCGQLGQGYYLDRGGCPVRINDLLAAPVLAKVPLCLAALVQPSPLPGCGRRQSQVELAVRLVHTAGAGREDDIGRGAVAPPQHLMATHRLG